ncbi:hypothetical protein [Calycomorphotria hydatis]|uniref:Uncharacterized protein n=1 Tax=Calycomorphotria hydatis TaxID=2528027 RepID=A0A517T9H4_9PLAN|nr:hypothetical protein [Calycomorphotria hydatis]QDT65023.1 hypothetical protein V22_22690 [Calycomorphotria hydatis]
MNQPAKPQGLILAHAKHPGLASLGDRFLEQHNLGSLHWRQTVAGTQRLLQDWSKSITHCLVVQSYPLQFSINVCQQLLGTGTHCQWTVVLGGWCEVESRAYPHRWPTGMCFREREYLNGAGTDSVRNIDLPVTTSREDLFLASATIDERTHHGKVTNKVTVISRDLEWRLMMEAIFSGNRTLSGSTQSTMLLDLDQQGIVASEFASSSRPHDPLVIGLTSDVDHRAAHQRNPACDFILSKFLGPDALIRAVERCERESHSVSDCTRMSA